MIRIKLPFGHITYDQLKSVAHVARLYAGGTFHLTTRQDIQLNFVKESDVDSIWKILNKVGITGKEEFGNTIRNISCSPYAGVHKDEAFDVSTYIHEILAFFKNHESVKDLGNKIKIGFGCVEEDISAIITNDIGILPINKNGLRGFKIYVGGGLAGKAIEAQVAKNYLEEYYLIPYLESIFRIFSQYGERIQKRKGRMKFLVEELGIEEFIKIVDVEFSKINKVYHFDLKENNYPIIEALSQNIKLNKSNIAFDNWSKTNLFEQKQNGYYSILVKIPQGNLQSNIIEKLIQKTSLLSINDIRITSSQDLLLRFIKQEDISNIYSVLKSLNLHEAGAERINDITSCAGTYTCNLGIINSYSLAQEIEGFIDSKHQNLILDRSINIKISACMNSCGHHNKASIGLQGTIINTGSGIVPAVKFLLGGGISSKGQFDFGMDTCTVPVKKAISAINLLLNDYQSKSDHFIDYCRENDKQYFRNLLEEYIDKSNISNDDYKDWGSPENYEKKDINFKRTATFSKDLIGDLLQQSLININHCHKSLQNENFNDCILHSYNLFVRTCKAMLLVEDKQFNTQLNILKTFEELLIKPKNLVFEYDFKEYVLSYKKEEITKSFVEQYFKRAEDFYFTCLPLIKNIG